MSDVKTAMSAQFKREVAELHTALGELASSQVAMVKVFVLRRRMVLGRTSGILKMASVACALRW